MVKHRVTNSTDK